MFGPGAFRLVLAYCVCLGHMSRVNVGETAVCVFFLLSGYWVVRMYREKYARLPFPNTTFWIARFFRIWILYVVCVTVTMVIYAVGFGRYDPEQWYGLLLFGTATHGRDVLGVSWSLDIEVQFYLLAPAIVALLAAAGSRARLVAAIAATVLLSFFGLYLEDRFNVEVLLAYLSLFMAGALVHVLDFRPGGRVALLSALVFVAVGVLVLTHPDLGALLNKKAANPFNDRWFAVGWSLFLVPFVAWNVRQRSPAFDRHLGNLSYSVYLVHVPFYATVSMALGDPSPMEKLALLALTIPIALIPYLLVDRPVERHREGFARALASRLHGRTAARKRDAAADRRSLQ